VLLLGIIQIGPSVILVPLIIWSWFAMDTTTAVFFIVLIGSGNFVDNILCPAVSEGPETPKSVVLIAVLCGTLVPALIGLFVGPIVLSIAGQLLVVWTRDGPKSVGRLEGSRGP